MRKRTTLLLAGLVLALAAVRAGAAEAGAWSVPLTLAGSGPYYTLRVPMALRSRAQRDDLADLRVRNAAGEPMPQAWLPERGESIPPDELTATIYKVPAPAPAASAPPQPQAWIVDMTQDGLLLERLSLDLAPEVRGVFSLRIEASDDLQTWRPIRSAAQVVQLTAPEKADFAELLRATDIDLASTPARYLRLSTEPGAPVPVFAGARVRVHGTKSNITLEHTFEWGAPIAPAACDERHCDYPLPPNVPVERVQVVLAERDTVSPFTVLVQGTPLEAPPVHRRHPLRGALHALRDKERTAPSQERWDWLTETTAWWVNDIHGGGDSRSPPVELQGVLRPMLRLQTAGTMRLLGPTPPSVRIGARPATLVFLARGQGPFRIELAPPDESPTTMTPAQLMPTYRLDSPWPIDTATPVLASMSPAASTPTTAHAPTTTTTHRPDAPWLWAALLAGVGLMGAMAWSLLRKH